MNADYIVKAKGNGVYAFILSDTEFLLMDVPMK